MTKPKQRPRTPQKPSKMPSTSGQKLLDDFVSVARRLGADEDKASFEAKLAKIVKTKLPVSK